VAARPEITGRSPASVGCDDVDAYSIQQFCARHNISIAAYYKLRQKRLTPREIRLGARVLISKESAAAWRREREAATEGAV
jgi:hypothetical protein